MLFQEFIINTNSYFFNYIIAIIMLGYGYFMYPITRRAFKEDIESKWSTVITTILVFVIGFSIISPAPDGKFIMPYPINFYMAWWFAVWTIIFLISTIVGKTKDESYSEAFINNAESDTGKVYHELSSKQKINELNRKMVHLSSSIYASGVFLAGLAGGAIYLLTYHNNLAMNPWEESYNWYVMAKGFKAAEVGFGFTLMGMVGSFIVQINAEIVRFRAPEIPFILKKGLQKTRRVSETKTFGAHIDYIVGLMFAVVMLSWINPSKEYQALNAVAAMIITSSLSDMMAGLFGRKYGKKKWPFNESKSYIGSLAGSIAAFIASFLFVGWFMAIITVIVMLVVDLFLTNHLSDNLVNPIALSITYIIFIQFINPVLPLDWFVITFL